MRFSEAKGLMPGPERVGDGEHRTLPEVDRNHPLVVALLSMNRVQRRAFGAELKKLNRRPGSGLKTAWQAARDRGWRGVIPVGTTEMVRVAERLAQA